MFTNPLAKMTLFFFFLNDIWKFLLFLFFEITDWRGIKGQDRFTEEIEKRKTKFFHVVCGPNMADLIGRRHPTASTTIPSTVHCEPQWRSEEDSEEQTEDSASSSSDEREPLHSEAHQPPPQQQQSCYLSSETPFSGGVTPNHPGNPSLGSLSRSN